MNLILLVDSYKESQRLQYRRGTSMVNSYFEPRAGGVNQVVIPFGFQYGIKRYLTTPITAADIDEAESYFQPHMGMFEREKWEYILQKHRGYLPIEVCAVPEGTPIPIDNVLLKVRNTDPNCFWLTSYIETLLVQNWYPATVATRSRVLKGVLAYWLYRTGDPSLLPFKLHDFGCRGSTCMEQASIGGAAHLVNFRGTDTVPALKVCREYYHELMAGYSIPASEHSTITSWGEVNEVDAYRNMIRQFGHFPLYACVSDSYDVLRACTELWGGVLKEEVLNAKGTLVVRPDSGEPKKMVPQVLDALWASFGGTVNDKGYKVLNPKVRVIQGDGITFDTLSPICHAIANARYSLDNVAFGSGGGLLQQVNRDTQRFAYKCSQTEYDGHIADVSKRPTSDRSKWSKAGDQELYQLDDYSYKTDRAGLSIGEPVLRPIFRNGELLVDDTLAAIRGRADAWSSLLLS